CMQGTHLPTF
nr:immunoglobulin light chain junction region [Macaca mulatta]MOW09784.1 immunoglobulin light chain junction region [Macaca mulatta]MOW10999.1 immunoglobulin light chain junction region [Macaca mulatta]MOW11090.1 immunoglobulin light chain junction region [Macaca mulatta]MOW11241.1 immunoglobulin light chain junction region [Macaca mulatta]